MRNLCHCDLTVVERGYERIESGVIILVNLIIKAEIVKRFSVKILYLAHHAGNCLVLHIFDFQIGKLVIGIIELIVVSGKLLEHFLEDRDSGSDQESKLLVVLVFIEIGIILKPINLHFYSPEIVRTVLVIGNAHCNQRTDVSEYVGVTLHKHCCKLVFVNAVVEYVTKSFILASVKSAIEIKLTVCRLCKEVTCVIGFDEIVDRLKIDLAHCYVFIVALFDHFLIVTEGIAAVHLHNGKVGNCIVDIRCGLICKPYAYLIGIFVEVLV